MNTTPDALLAYAEEGRKALRGRDAGAAMERLELLHPELASAFEHFLGVGRVEEAFRLAAALVPFWLASKRIAEGDDWFTRATSSSGGSDAARARALYEHGYLIFLAGDYERSQELSGRAIALGRAANDPTTVSLALSVLARRALDTDVEEAKRLLLEALAVTEGTDDQDGRSSAMHVLGVAYQMSGQFEEAREVMSERIALGRQTGNDYLIAVETGNLSMVERQLGNLDQAQRLARESIELFQGLGDELAVAWSANSNAAVAAAKSDLQRAAQLLGFAEAGIERAGGEWPPDERQQHDETLKTLEAGLPATDLESARAAGRAMSTKQGVELAVAAPGPDVAGG